MLDYLMLLSMFGCFYALITDDPMYLGAFMALGAAGFMFRSNSMMGAFVFTAITVGCIVVRRGAAYVDSRGNVCRKG